MVYKGVCLLNPLQHNTLTLVDNYPSSRSEIRCRQMAQGIPLWNRKLETEHEPEFAIVILGAILFLISHIAPLHYCSYFTSLMGRWLRRIFSAGNGHLETKYPISQTFVRSAPLNSTGVTQQKLRADSGPVSTCISCCNSLI